MLLVCLIWFDAVHCVPSLMFMLILIVGSNLGRRVAAGVPRGPMGCISPLAHLKGSAVPFSVVIITVSRPTPSLVPPTETLPPIEMAGIGVMHVLWPIWRVPCPWIIVMGVLPICICLVRGEPWRLTGAEIRGPYVITPVTVCITG